MGRPVLLDDVATDKNWPRYSRALAAEGCRSALGVPMDLGKTAEAVLNFFAPTAGVFTDTVIKEAEGFAHVAGSTLRLAIRIETGEQLNADLKTAMATRTIIDAACGVIMAQNRCATTTHSDCLPKPPATGTKNSTTSQQTSSPASESPPTSPCALTTDTRVAAPGPAIFFGSGWPSSSVR
ncbi:GAF domain-containing protein [Pseudarthrobacter sp. NS4]|uniref:GAF domain-containing protein n=1 Tax=Pseudarthrobacter sp. NS4 TaxID=2973976 RepID=UPI003CC82720